MTTPLLTHKPIANMDAIELEAFDGEVADELQTIANRAAELAVALAASANRWRWLKRPVAHDTLAVVARDLSEAAGTIDDVAVTVRG